MKVQHVVLFDTLERVHFRDHVLPLAGLVCDEEDITGDTATRAQRKRDGASPQAGWYSVLRRLAAKGEAWNEEQLERALEVVRSLAAEVERQSHSDGWPAPSSKAERGVRDTLVQVRALQREFMPDALRMLEDAWTATQNAGFC